MVTELAISTMETTTKIVMMMVLILSKGRGDPERITDWVMPSINSSYKPPTQDALRSAGNQTCEQAPCPPRAF